MRVIAVDHLQGLFPIFRLSNIEAPGRNELTPDLSRVGTVLVKLRGKATPSRDA